MSYTEKGVEMFVIKAVPSVNRKKCTDKSHASISGLPYKVQQ